MAAASLLFSLLSLFLFRLGEIILGSFLDYARFSVVVGQASFCS